MSLAWDHFDTKNDPPDKICMKYSYIASYNVVISRCICSIYSELLRDEIPSKFSDSLPKMLRHVINYTKNTNISASKFTC